MADVPSFKVPQQVRDFTESSLEQARKAFADFIEAARRTTDTLQGSTDLARTDAQTLVIRGLDDAEQNVRAALNLEQNIAAAHSTRAVFVHERFAAMQAQTQDLDSFIQGAFPQTVEYGRAAVQQGADTALRPVEQTAP